jgi:hypothetical protein
MEVPPASASSGHAVPNDNPQPVTELGHETIDGYDLKFSRLTRRWRITAPSGKAFRKTEPTLASARRAVRAHQAKEAARQAPKTEWCVEPGHWKIHGYDVQRVSTSGTAARWLITDPGGRRRPEQPPDLRTARTIIKRLPGSQQTGGKTP